MPGHGESALKSLFRSALEEGSRKGEHRYLSSSYATHRKIVYLQSEHEEDYVSVRNREVKISELSSLSSKSNLSSTTREITFFKTRSTSTSSRINSNGENETSALITEESFC